MKRQAIVVFGLVFVFSAVTLAQVKTITNADLEQFKQARLKAEKELRENYKALGFPSPEELQRRNEKSQREMAELSDRLRADRLARDRIRAQAAIRNSGQVQYSDEPQFTNYNGYYGTSFYYRNYPSNRYFRTNRFFRNNRLRRNNSGRRNRVRGRIGPNVRNRNRSFGPSRRLTRQNRIKSSRRNVSGFGISIRGSRN